MMSSFSHTSIEVGTSSHSSLSKPKGSVGYSSKLGKVQKLKKPVVDPKEVLKRVAQANRDATKPDLNKKVQQVKPKTSDVVSITNQHDENLSAYEKRKEILRVAEKRVAHKPTPPVAVSKALKDGKHKKSSHAKLGSRSDKNTKDSSQKNGDDDNWSRPMSAKEKTDVDRPTKEPRKEKKKRRPPGPPPLSFADIMAKAEQNRTQAATSGVISVEEILQKKLPKSEPQLTPRQREELARERALIFDSRRGRKRDSSKISAAPSTSKNLCAHSSERSHVNPNISSEPTPSAVKLKEEKKSESSFPKTDSRVVDGLSKKSSKKEMERSVSNKRSRDIHKQKPVELSNRPGLAALERFERPRESLGMNRRADDGYDYDENDEDDLSDFIDDGPVEGENDVSAAIKQIFGYDRKKYFYSDDDDDDCMESNFHEIEREEKRSAKLGRMEDLEDIRREEEKRKKRLRKK